MMVRASGMWLRVILCALVVGLAGRGGAGAAEVLLRTDFETDPALQGWGNDAVPRGQNVWTTAQSHSPTHSIRTATRWWYTPAITLTPFEMYSVEFHAKTGGRGMYGPISDPFSEYVNTGDWERNTKVFRAEAGETFTHIIFNTTRTLAPVYVDDVTVRRLSRAEAAVAQDEFWGTMPNPSFAFDMPRDRHVNVPTSIGKLKAGEDLKVVMLGDSIVNDTSHGVFEPLIDRMYPGSRTNLVTSVRGNTGMWWYKEENRLAEYVFRHDPDLVMIGGISHLNDIESVREVIRQIRVNDAETEIVLMSELAGFNDPYTRPELLKNLDPTGGDWRGELWCLAVDEGVGFIDMTQPWARYIVESGEAWDWYLRDAIHMNGRGSALAGRIMEAWFASAVNPEPGMMGILGVGAVGLLRRWRVRR